MMMKTDKSVHMMRSASSHPHVETWGYSDLVNDVIQVNPQIHRCDTDHVLIQINPQIHLWDDDDRVWITGFASYHSRVETRGYSELIDDLIQINPQIHLWDFETLHPQITISVSTDYQYLKTDESVRTGFASHNPRVETRGYSDLVNDVIQVNPQIHRCDTDRVLIQSNPQIHLWDFETLHPQITISVSTDYEYLKTDESVRTGFASYDPRVETWGYSDEPFFHFREWLFHSRNELFTMGKQSFSSGMRLFSSGKELFTCGNQSFCSGMQSFSSGKELFHQQNYQTIEVIL